MAVKVLAMNVVCEWIYPETSITNGLCDLCRHDIMGPNPDDIKNGNYTSSIIFGECKHCYHSTCFSKLPKPTISCPIDKTPWRTIKEINPLNECAVNVAIPRQPNQLNQGNSVKVV